MFICATGRMALKEGFRCQRISQPPFDSRDRLYLNEATILRENPANLLIPISVFGLRDSKILLICFCLSDAAGGLEWNSTHLSVGRSVSQSVYRCGSWTSIEHEND